MPLSPTEIQSTVARLIRLVPRVARWRRLEKAEREAVLDELIDLAASFALDLVD